jgi:hypothetical protein
VDDIEEAWLRWLESGTGIPTGLSAFLKTSEASTDDDGRLVLRPLPGPAHERLGSRAVLEHIREGLAPYLTRRPEIVVGAPAEPPAPGRRVTQEEVHADTLRALYRQEPRLERAVQELDLELMD